MWFLLCFYKYVYSSVQTEQNSYLPIPPRHSCPLKPLKSFAFCQLFHSWEGLPSCDVLWFRVTYTKQSIVRTVDCNFPQVGHSQTWAPTRHQSQDKCVEHPSPKSASKITLDPINTFDIYDTVYVGLNWQDASEDRLFILI